MIRAHFGRRIAVKHPGAGLRRQVAIWHMGGHAELLRYGVVQYERRKEREKQEEEDRKGAANAVREGQFMYM
jgi:hypothetical protein